MTFAYAGFEHMFAPSGDLFDISHEVAERTNDPYATNQVPNWTMPGTSNCVSPGLMGVADATEGLTQPAFKVLSHGVTYTLTDVAGISWFTDRNPSMQENVLLRRHLDEAGAVLLATLRARYRRATCRVRRRNRWRCPRPPLAGGIRARWTPSTKLWHSLLVQLG